MEYYFSLLWFYDFDGKLFLRAFKSGFLIHYQNCNKSSILQKSKQKDVWCFLFNWSLFSSNLTFDDGNVNNSPFPLSISWSFKKKAFLLALRKWAIFLETRAQLRWCKSEQSKIYKPQTHASRKYIEGTVQKHTQYCFIRNTF